jgi:hypothetical protein
MELKLSPAEGSVPTKRGLVLGVLYVLLITVGTLPSAGDSFNSIITRFKLFHIIL